MARPIMRRFMSAASCISAARTTVEVMRNHGLHAVEIPICFALEVPARKYCRLAGFSAEERAEMKAKAANWQEVAPLGSGWDGHLIVLVENRWILDPAIDQADAPQFEVHVPAEVFVVDTANFVWNPREDFEAQLGLTLNNGDQAKLIYRRIRDRSYLKTEAWNDEGLPILALMIAEQMEVRP